MVTNGDRKTNNFGKLVRQKLGFFQKLVSAVKARVWTKVKTRASESPDETD